VTSSSVSISVSKPRLCGPTNAALAASAFRRDLLVGESVLDQLITHVANRERLSTPRTACDVVGLVFGSDLVIDSPNTDRYWCRAAVALPWAASRGRISSAGQRNISWAGLQRRRGALATGLSSRQRTRWVAKAQPTLRGLFFRAGA